MYDATSILSTFLKAVQVFRPRFVLSENHEKCREVVSRQNKPPLVMIRINIRNVGWWQDNPPACEVYLTQVRHNGRIVEKDESRLPWKDSIEDRFRAKIINNRLIDICSTEKSKNPVIKIWSERGAKSTGISSGSGTYEFDLKTVCKDSSPGRGTLKIDFNDDKWQNIRLVSLQTLPTWRLYLREIVTAVLIFLLVLYAAYPLSPTRSAETVTKYPDVFRFNSQEPNKNKFQIGDCPGMHCFVFERAEIINGPDGNKGQVFILKGGGFVNESNLKGVIDIWFRFALKNGYSGVRLNVSDSKPIDVWSFDSEHPLSDDLKLTSQDLMLLVPLVKENRVEMISAEQDLYLFIDDASINDIRIRAEVSSGSLCSGKNDEIDKKFIKRACGHKSTNN